MSRVAQAAMVTLVHLARIALPARVESMLDRASSLIFTAVWAAGHVHRGLQRLSYRFRGAALACITTIVLSLVPGVVHSQVTGTAVRFITSAGPIDVGLYDADAPRTVQNFLAYVRGGAYAGSLFHRLIPGFVLQGGGFRFSDTTTPKLTTIPTLPPVANEFSPTRSNLRGTVAMAKIANNPDSATNQWFINLANNSANLDVQNGGFTVFGRLLSPTLTTADVLARLTPVDARSCTVLGAGTSALAQLPMFSVPQTCGQITASALAVVQGVVELRRNNASASERVFDFLEAGFPQFTTPSSPPTYTSQGLTFRFYAQSGNHLGTFDGRLYVLAPAFQSTPIDLGPLQTWVDAAVQAGY